MALRVSENWTVSRIDLMRGIVRAGLQASPTFYPQWLPSGDWGRQISVILSIGLHSLFIVALVYGGGGEHGEPGSISVSRLTVFDVPSPRVPAPFSIEENEGQGKDETDTAIIADTAPKYEATRQEWSLEHIPVQPTVARVVAELSLRQGKEDRGGSGLADGSGQAFDPYAGASPQYRNSGPEGGNSFDNMDPWLDQAAFSDFIRRLRQKLGLIRGQVILSVMADQFGVVTESEISGGPAGIQLQLYVRANVVGEKLYRPGAGNAQRRLEIIL